MSAGPEDTAYLLRPTSPPQLYVLSSDGRVLHHVPIEQPAPNMVPMNMSVAGRSSLLISFDGTAVNKKGQQHYVEIFGVFDPATGRVLSAYKLPKGDSVMPACAAGGNDFLFIGSTKTGKLEVVQYSGG